MSGEGEPAALRIRVQIVQGEDVKLTIRSERTFTTIDDATERAADLLRWANVGQTVGKRSA